MVTQLRWLTLLGVVVLAAASGCAAMHHGPPRDLIERNDHAGLTAWYERHAAHLRAHAEEMRTMATDYQRRATKPGGPPSELVRHCQSLAARYTKAAEEADQLAQLHKEQMGKL
jgi:hypothetical protein